MRASQGGRYPLCTRSHSAASYLVVAMARRSSQLFDELVRRKPWRDDAALLTWLASL